MLASLPAENRETIHLLSSHFQLVSQHSVQNKMDSHALQTTLAILFGLTIAKFPLPL
jgi:hypothetical protein